MVSLPGVGALLSGVGTLAGGLGGGQKGGQPIPAWDQVPKPVQEAIIDTYLPAALEDFNRERVPTPMLRVAPDSSPLAPRGIQNLQAYSDQMGGMFTPPQEQQVAPPQQTNPEQMQGMMQMMQLMGQGGAHQTKQNAPWQQFAQKATPEQLAEMSGYFGGAEYNKFTGGLTNDGENVPYQNLLAQVGYG